MSFPYTTRVDITFPFPLNKCFLEMSKNCNRILCEKCPGERRVFSIYLEISERPILFTVHPDRGDSTSAKELFVSTVISFLNIHTIHPTLPNPRESKGQVCNRMLQVKSFFI